MTSTQYFNGKKFEVEEIGGGNLRISRDGANYSVTTSAESVRRWQSGEYIQDAMPELSVDEREFLISGFTPEQWTTTFGDDEEA